MPYFIGVILSQKRRMYSANNRKQNRQIARVKRLLEDVISAKRNTSETDCQGDSEISPEKLGLIDVQKRELLKE